MATIHPSPAPISYANRICERERFAPCAPSKVATFAARTLGHWSSAQVPAGLINNSCIPGAPCAIICYLLCFFSSLRRWKPAAHFWVSSPVSANSNKRHAFEKQPIPRWTRRETREKPLSSLICLRAVQRHLTRGPSPELDQALPERGIQEAILCRIIDFLLFEWF